MYLSLIYWEEGKPVYTPEPIELATDVDGSWYIAENPTYRFYKEGWSHLVNRGNPTLIPCLGSLKDVIGYVHHNPAVCVAYIEGFYSGLSTGILVTSNAVASRTPPSFN